MRYTIPDNALLFPLAFIMFHFFQLPREVRDMIYNQYALCEGGYVLNPQTNKLSGGTNNQPIDLSLMFTCKRVATEMKGLALAANTLTFSTFYSPEERMRAGHYHLALNELQGYLERSLQRLPRHFLWDDMYAEISAAYPEFTAIMDTIRDGTLAGLLLLGSCGEVPSTHRSFIRFVWRTVSHYSFRYNDEFTKAFGNRHGDSLVHIDLMNYTPVPWAIPTRHGLTEITSLFGGEISLESRVGFDARRRRSDHFERTKFRYSAAAVAIRFLESIPPTTRAQIKTMVLLEDREAVADPECHALGLIPFCQENPCLRVERRVSLWRNAFLYNSLMTSSFQRFRFGGEGLAANEVSFSVARWIMEASALIPAGMPPESFTLVLDGEQDPKCAEIFQTVVLRDAVWQQAMEESLKRGNLPSITWAKRREDQRSLNHGYGGYAYEAASNHSYIFDKFPQAVAEMVEGTSIVRCNFEPGELGDVEQLVEERKSWRLHEWRGKWYERNPETFLPSPGFTSWKDILREYVLSK